MKQFYDLPQAAASSSVSQSHSKRVDQLCGEHAFPSSSA